MNGLSALSLPEFVAALDGIYERSPWVAAAAWQSRPFENLAGLHAALSDAVARAGEVAQLALLQAHPQLASRAAVRGDLTALSAAEQGRAGLDRCSPAEFASLSGLNAEYSKKFGFPFIVAVRGLTPADIVAMMTRRLDQPRDKELQESLRQVDRIALLRLRDRFPGWPS